MSRGYTFRGFAPRPFNKLNIPDMPSEEFMNALGVKLPGKMSFSTPMDKALGSNGASVSSTNSGMLGKAGGALGGVMSGLNAANDFKNGNYVDGALNTAKTVATFVPGGQPVAAAIQAGQTIKNLFGNKGNGGQALLNKTMQESENALNNTKNFAQNAQQQDYSQPILPTNNEITGGASPVDNINAQVFQDYMNNNPVTNAIQQLDSNNINAQESTQPLTAEISQEETKRGLLDKFLSGVSDLSRGYQENRSEGFNPNNLTADKFTETITNPANTQKIVDYQNQLTNDAAYNDWATRAGVDKAAAIKAIEEGKNSGNADVDNWIKNNQDAYKETQETKTYNKGKMARLGEALGTMGRVAQNPLVQGLVAGGLSAALTGNPLYGLGQGYKFANNRAMSDIYSNALKQYGFDVPNVGMFGNLGSKDVHTIMYPQVEQMKNDRELARLQALNDYRTGQLENQKIKNAISQQNADTNKQKALIQEYKAKNGSKVTHVSTGGGKKTGSVTGTKNPNYNQALSQYYGILQSGDPKKISYARQRFIREIGVDPDTKIKQAAKKQGGASAPSNDEEAFLREIGW